MKEKDDIYNAIKHDINAQSRSFKVFLRDILDRESYELLLRLSRVTDVYIFSGIIRDFLTGQIDSIRDLDVVVKSKFGGVFPYNYLKVKNVTRNSFGGLKIKLPEITIDAWYLQDTWGIVRRAKNSNVNSLLETAFFNFSAIVFDLRNSKFIYNNHFADFLLTDTMDIVYEDNPNIPLCLFNVFYFHDRYGFNIGDKLRIWVRKNKLIYTDFRQVQLTHLGRIQYSNHIINQFLNLL